MFKCDNNLQEEELQSLTYDDLLSFSFQVAKGMEFLSAKYVSWTFGSWTDQLELGLYSKIKICDYFLKRMNTYAYLCECTVEIKRDISYDHMISKSFIK